MPMSFSCLDMYGLHSMVEDRAVTEWSLGILYYSIYIFLYVTQGLKTRRLSLPRY